MAIETPMASPRAASARTHPASTPTVIAEGSTAGQRPKSAIVNPRASATRTGSGAAFSPGIGTNTSAPLTRARTKRKEKSVPTDRVRLAGIAAQVSQQRYGIRHHALQHPRQQEEEPGEKRHQARDGAEGVVLHRGRNLHQADRDAGYKPDRQQRRGQPERRQKRLPDDLNHGVGSHQ